MWLLNSFLIFVLQKTFKILASAWKAKLKTLFHVDTNENKESGILQKAWKCITGDVHSQGLQRLHRLWASLLANRFYTRKSHGFPLRVNPILVFAANQLSTTSTVAHCKSIGSSSRSQPTAKTESRLLDPIVPAVVSWERPDRSSNKYFLYRLPLNDRNIAEFERTTSFRQVRDREIEAKNKFCLMHFADLSFSLDLIISPNDDYYRI